MAPEFQDDDAVKTVDRLKRRIRRLERSQKISEILLEISNAVDTTPNLDDLFISIHASLKRILDVPNIYISMYDRENGLLHFPYFIDEADGNHTRSVKLFDEASLTGEVIIRARPLLLDEKALFRRYREKRIVGSLPKNFLGVPLILNGTVLGVIAIQNYDDPQAYSVEDMDMLVSISQQIAVAIDRKRINDVLKENEERFRTLTEKSHDIIMRFDRSCRYLYVNPAIRRIGLLPEPMLGKTPGELDFPEPLAKLWKTSILKVFETCRMNRVEFELPNEMWIDCLLCPEYSEDNQVNSVITFSRDITERKQMEFYNRCYDQINHIIIGAVDMEEMLNGILDAMLGIFNCDRAWILFPCNPEAEAYEVPFLKCGPGWYIKPGSRYDITREVGRILESLLNAREPVIFDSVTQIKVREEIWSEIQVRSQIAMAVFPKTGDAWGVGLHQCSYDRIWNDKDSRLFNGICQRISDGLSNMLLFKALGETRKYIENVVDSMPSVLIGVDADGLVIQWNAQATLETSIEAPGAVGHPFVRFFPHLKRFENLILSAVRDQEILEKIKVPYTLEGDRDTRYDNITVYPLKDTEIKGAVIRMDNVTEQIKLEEMMIQSEKMLSVGGLAAGMAHEINNPLAGMMQNAQVLFNRLATDLPANLAAAREAGTTMDVLITYMEKRKIFQQLAHINDAGRHAARVVENMLSFSRKAEGSKKPEDLPLLMKKTIELAQNDYDLKKRFDFKKIRIVQHRETHFPMVSCEASKIQQVFLNIIKNGAEAMAENYLETGRSPEFRIQYVVEEPFAVVRIRDNGPGMDERTRKRVFEPFFTTKTVDRGTGLGLSVAFFIITDDHKGELSVDSIPGQETRFTVRLPIHG